MKLKKIIKNKIKKHNKICEDMLLSNLKVTNSLKVYFTEFAWEVFCLSSFYF